MILTTTKSSELPELANVSNSNSDLDRDPLIDEATARRLVGDVSRSTLHRLVRSGRVPRPIKIGSSSRWRRSWIEQFVADCQHEATR